MWLDKLRAMKAESGYTTREIAERSTIPEPTLEKLFSGATKDPKLTTIQQLVHFFGYSLDDLDDSTSKKAPSISDEAMKIAMDYDAMDEHGRSVVSVVMNLETKRVKQESMRSMRLIARGGDLELNENKIEDLRRVDEFLDNGGKDI